MVVVLDLADYFTKYTSLKDLYRAKLLIISGLKIKYILKPQNGVVQNKGYNKK